MTKINNKTAKISLQAKEIENGILIVKICGSENSMCELDMQTITSFEYESDKLLSQCKLKLIIDMAYVDHVDSEGVWSVFELDRKAKEKKVKIVFVNVTENVKRVFDMTKLSTKVKMAGSEIEATNFLTKEL